MCFRTVRENIGKCSGFYITLEKASLKYGSRIWVHSTKVPTVPKGLQQDLDVHKKSPNSLFTHLAYAMTEDSDVGAYWITIAPYVSFLRTMEEKAWQWLVQAPILSTP